MTQTIEKTITKEEKQADLEALKAIPPSDYKALSALLGKYHEKYANDDEMRKRISGVLGE